MPLQKIRKELEGIYNKSLSKIEESHKEVDTLEQDKIKLIDNLNKAQDEADVEKYAKIRKELDSIDVIIDMHKNRIKEQETNPVISKEEAKAYKGKIKDALDQYNISKNNELLLEIEGLISKYSELSEVLVEGRDLIELVHHKLEKNKMYNNGYDGWATYQLIEFIKNNYQLKRMKEQSEKEI